MDKVLIFGNGYVGNMFKERLPGATITSANITDAVAVNAALDEHQPDIVINCAGKTGRPNVDWCESNKEATLASNVHGPLNLARICHARNLHLTHIGSGCVYTGDNGGKGYAEDDPPNFFGSFYSMTKILSEHGLKGFPVLQLRLRMPLDSVPGPRNFITKITSYSKVISVPNSISVMSDFMTGATALIKQRATGVYNMTNPGAIAHDEILALYKEIVNPAHTYTRISMQELDAMTAAGRSNCKLSTEKLEAAGIVLPDVHTAVRNALHTYKKHLAAQ